MRKVSVSSTLTVFHDGQFWMGVVERNESGRLAVSKTLFGAEPSNEEILRFVVEKWQDLDFSEPIADSELPKEAVNPKRRMREASRAVRRCGVSTKAQQVLSQERESRKAKAKSDNAERRQLLKEQRFEQKKAKRKQKKRGK
ncbi:MAG: YjdF family protein [Eggerthellaceae bacterium]|nr:YjdF family protein [Eggerthellaceae bacterium]